MPWPDNTTEAIFKALELCAACDHYERFGEQHDGGYIMCLDDAPPGSVVGALSYGINGYDQWGTDVSLHFGVPVYEFDCFDARAPTSGGNLAFRAECAKSARDNSTDPKFKTILEHLAETGLAGAPAASLIMKMDIEGAEWRILAEEPAETLAKFRQLIFELHSFDNLGLHPTALAALQKLRAAGFVPTHLHGNNCCPMMVVGPYQVPKVLEVTWVRLPRNQTCAKSMAYHLALDADNSGWASLPDPVLP